MLSVDNRDFLSQPGMLSDDSALHCECYHLSSFASRFLIAPNDIDFSIVENLDSAEGIGEFLATA